MSNIPPSAGKSVSAGQDSDGVTSNDSAQRRASMMFLNSTIFPEIHSSHRQIVEEEEKDEVATPSPVRIPSEILRDTTPVSLSNGEISKGNCSTSSVTSARLLGTENDNDEQDQVPSTSGTEKLRCVQSAANSNCTALLPFTGKSQMIPIALFHNASGLTSDECSPVGGIMQLISGTNKVAPAGTPVNPNDSATVGAVLMLIPKKSDAVCVNIPEQQDLENNLWVENQLEQRAGCSNGCVPGTSASQCRSDHGVTTVKTTPSYDSYEEVCRICHDNPSKMELISPCLCKGSMSKVHRSCLERWLGEAAKNSCEICGYEYNTVRKPKYTGIRSVFEWIRHPLSPADMRNLFFDIACFFILTPLAVVSAWLCITGARHYRVADDRRRRTQHVGRILDEATGLQGRDPRAEATNATWTSVGLMSLTATLAAAYSVWLFVAVKYHISAWREWQQRNYTVTIVPFEDGCMGRPPPPPVHPHPPAPPTPPIHFRRLRPVESGTSNNESATSNNESGVSNNNTGLAAVDNMNNYCLDSDPSLPGLNLLIY